MKWDSFVVFVPAGHLTKQWRRQGGTLGRFAFNKLLSLGLFCYSFLCLINLNTVIRRLNLQSSAYICWLTESEMKWITWFTARLGPLSSVILLSLSTCKLNWPPPLWLTIPIHSCCHGHHKSRHLLLHLALSYFSVDCKNESEIIPLKVDWGAGVCNLQLTNRLWNLIWVKVLICILLLD